MSKKIINAQFDNESIRAIKNMIDPTGKLNDSQIDLFMHVCKTRNLDPRLKEVFAIPRYNSGSGKTELTIQVSIDGLRLIAERTGKYSPGSPTEFIYNEKGDLIGATSFVKKLTADGTWHEVSATAFLSEYKPSEQKKAMFWNKMPAVMIEKCAEARALRRAFPSDFSGLYSQEEMDQATPVDQSTTIEREATPVQNDILESISFEEYNELMDYIREDERYKEQLLSFLQKHCKVNSLDNMPKKIYARVLESAKKNWESKQKQTIGV